MSERGQQLHACRPTPPSLCPVPATAVAALAPATADAAAAAAANVAFLPACSAREAEVVSLKQALAERDGKLKAARRCVWRGLGGGPKVGRQVDGLAWTAGTL